MRLRRRASKTRSTAWPRRESTQMITTRLLSSLLLGANEQVNGCDCGGGFAGVGSFSLGSHGRWAPHRQPDPARRCFLGQLLSGWDQCLSLPDVAASLRYDPANWGSSRPFVEFGAALSPYITASYTRYYTNFNGPTAGAGRRIVDRSGALGVRTGRLGRPVHANRRGRDLRRSGPQLAAIGRLHRSSNRGQSLSPKP